MSTIAPAPPTPPVAENAAEPPPPRRRWLDRAGVRTVVGLAVLVAIIGGLLAVDRWVYSTDLGPLDTRSPEVGELAPAFALRDPDGNARSLSDYRGKVVWVNFWATWCGPCRRELPEMQRLADLYPERLAVLAVNLQESSGTAASFWEELELDLPILLDSSGEVAEQYRVGNRLPSHFFIDEEGVLRALRIGIITEDEMRQQLEELGLTTAAELLNAD